MEVAETILSL